MYGMVGCKAFMKHKPKTRIMRYTILSALIIAAFAVTGCEKALDIEKEKAAIMAVMEKETQTYIDRDFEGMFSTHVQDSTNIRLTAGADNYVFAEGWENVSRHMTGDETEDDLGPDVHSNVEKTDFRFKICPQSAFVICNQKWTSTYDEDVIEIESIQVRYLEKVEGEWKISFVSFIGTSGYMDDETEELFD
jgi:hypothetical protein